MRRRTARSLAVHATLCLENASHFIVFFLNKLRQNLTNFNNICYNSLVSLALAVEILSAAPETSLHYLVKR